MASSKIKPSEATGPFQGTLARFVLLSLPQPKVSGTRGISGESHWPASRNVSKPRTKPGGNDGRLEKRCSEISTW